MRRPTADLVGALGRLASSVRVRASKPTERGNLSMRAWRAWQDWAPQAEAAPLQRVLGGTVSGWVGMAWGVL